MQTIENNDKNQGFWQEVKDERGDVANIHLHMAPFMEGAQAHYEFYKKIMLSDSLPLSRQAREYLATQVSESNKCPYCMAHHKKALELNHSSTLSEQEKETLEKLATFAKETPWKLSLVKEKFLRYFTEKQWRHAIMVVGYFHMANRIAFGLNLELEDNYEKSCQ